jgi:WD40 repeat protein
MRRTMAGLVAALLLVKPAFGQPTPMGQRDHEVSIQEGIRFSQVALSSDGAKVACIGGGGSIHVYETSSGCKLFQTVGHEAPIGTVAFSPSGKWVAAGGALKTILSVEYVGNFTVFTTEEMAKTIAFQIHPTLLVFGNGKGWKASFEGSIVTIFDATTGQPVHRYTDFERPVDSVAFDKNETMVVAVDTNLSLYRSYFADQDCPVISRKAAIGYDRWYRQNRVFRARVPQK